MRLSLFLGAVAAIGAHGESKIGECGTEPVDIVHLRGVDAVGREFLLDPKALMTELETPNARMGVAEFGSRVAQNETDLGMQFFKVLQKLDKTVGDNLVPATPNSNPLSLDSRLALVAASKGFMKNDKDDKTNSTRRLIILETDAMPTAAMKRLLRKVRQLGEAEQKAPADLSKLPMTVDEINNFAWDKYEGQVSDMQVIEGLANAKLMVLTTNEAIKNEFKTLVDKVGTIEVLDASTTTTTTSTSTPTSTPTTTTTTTPGGDARKARALRGLEGATVFVRSLADPKPEANKLVIDQINKMCKDMQPEETKEKKFKWWHALLIVLGAILLAVGAVALFERMKKKKRIQRETQRVHTVVTPQQPPPPASHTNYSGQQQQQQVHVPASNTHTQQHAPLAKPAADLGSSTHDVRTASAGLGAGAAASAATARDDFSSQAKQLSGDLKGQAAGINKSASKELKKAQDQAADAVKKADSSVGKADAAVADATKHAEAKAQEAKAAEAKAAEVKKGETRSADADVQDAKAAVEKVDAKASKMGKDLQQHGHSFADNVRSTFHMK